MRGNFNRLKRKTLFFSFILIFLFSFFYALSFTVNAAITGEGLTISPPISEPQIKPGQSAEQTIRLTNPTSKLIEVYPRAMDFKAKGETGEPAFLDSATEAFKYSLASWVKFNQTKVALTPEQVVEFKYTITVPVDAEPGGHYAAIFFASEPPKSESQSSQVSISSMIGSLVLVTIPGQTIEKAVIDQFGAENYLHMVGDVNFISRISNVGNVHFKPKGKIKISGWFENPQELTVNEQNGNVLPDSTRRFENKWTPSGMSFGLYRADLNLTYGQNEKTLAASTTFWVIPWWAIIAFAIIIILIFSLIVWILKKSRKNKKPPKTQSPQGPESQIQPPSSNVILR